MGVLGGKGAQGSKPVRRHTAKWNVQNVTWDWLLAKLFRFLCWGLGWPLSRGTLHETQRLANNRHRMPSNCDNLAKNRFANKRYLTRGHSFDEIATFGPYFSD